MDTGKCEVRITSRIDGGEMIRTMPGSYRRKENSHIVVYTDYTGNVVTKNGMEICEDKMLLHRTGAFEGDMLFDPLTCEGLSNGSLQRKAWRSSVLL